MLRNNQLRLDKTPGPVFVLFLFCFCFCWIVYKTTGRYAEVAQNSLDGIACVVDVPTKATPGRSYP